MKYQGFDLTGKSIMVTGAGTGIGKAIAKGLAQAGADLILIGRRPDPLKETEKEVSDQGVKALVLAGGYFRSGFSEPGGLPDAQDLRPNRCPDQQCRRPF